MYGSPADLAWYIEENQCWSCTHKNFREDAAQPNGGYFMCPGIETELILDGKWPEAIDEDEYGVPYCNLYRDDSLDEESAPEQERLF